MVIFGSQGGVKLTIPPIRILVWGVQTTQDELLKLKWARERPFSVSKTYSPKLVYRDRSLESAVAVAVCGPWMMSIAHETSRDVYQ